MDLIVQVKLPLSPDDLAQLRTLGCDGPYDEFYFYAPLMYEDTLKSLPYVSEVKHAPQAIHQTITKTINVRSPLKCK